MFATIWQKLSYVAGWGMLSFLWCGVLPLEARAEYFHQESGVYHARARQYKTDLGIFLQRDSKGTVLVESDSSPTAGGQYDRQGMSLYAYVRSNPLNYSDPSGLEIWEVLVSNWHLKVDINRRCNRDRASHIARAAQLAVRALEKVWGDARLLDSDPNNETAKERLLTPIHRSRFAKHVREWFGPLTRSNLIEDIADKVVDMYEGIKEGTNSQYRVRAKKETVFADCAAHTTGPEANYIAYAWVAGATPTQPGVGYAGPDKYGWGGGIYFNAALRGRGNFFRGTRERQTQTMVHEFSHAYLGVTDNFYYHGNNAAWGLSRPGMTLQHRTNNADTWAYFIMEWWDMIKHP